jgi:hypothetical protein
LPVELAETPLNITVIRFAQDGIDENVMLVPLVVACDVPDVRTLLAIDDITAPEMVGLVNVVVVNVAPLIVGPVMVGLVSVLPVKV